MYHHLLVCAGLYRFVPIDLYPQVERICSAGAHAFVSSVSISIQVFDKHIARRVTVTLKRGHAFHTLKLPRAVSPCSSVRESLLIKRVPHCTQRAKRSCCGASRAPALCCVIC